MLYWTQSLPKFCGRFLFITVMLSVFHSTSALCLGVGLWHPLYFPHVGKWVKVLHISFFFHPTGFQRGWVIISSAGTSWTSSVHCLCLTHSLLRSSRVTQWTASLHRSLYWNNSKSLESDQPYMLHLEAACGLHPNTTVAVTSRAWDLFLILQTWFTAFPNLTFGNAVTFWWHKKAQIKPGLMFCQKKKKLLWKVSQLVISK